MTATRRCCCCCASDGQSLLSITDHKVLCQQHNQNHQSSISITNHQGPGQQDTHRQHQEQEEEKATEEQCMQHSRSSRDRTMTAASTCSQQLWGCQVTQIPQQQPLQYITKIQQGGLHLTGRMAQLPMGRPVTAPPTSAAVRSRPCNSCNGGSQSSGSGSCDSTQGSNVTSRSANNAQLDQQQADASEAAQQYVQHVLQQLQGSLELRSPQVKPTSSNVAAAAAALTRPPAPPAALVSSGLQEELSGSATCSTITSTTCASSSTLSETSTATAHQQSILQRQHQRQQQLQQQQTYCMVRTGGGFSPSVQAPPEVSLPQAAAGFEWMMTSARSGNGRWLQAALWPPSAKHSHHTQLQETAAATAGAALSVGSSMPGCWEGAVVQKAGDDCCPKTSAAVALLPQEAVSAMLSFYRQYCCVAWPLARAAKAGTAVTMWQPRHASPVSFGSGSSLSNSGSSSKGCEALLTHHTQPQRRQQQQPIMPWSVLEGLLVLLDKVWSRLRSWPMLMVMLIASNRSPTVASALQPWAPAVVHPSLEPMNVR